MSIPTIIGLLFGLGLVAGAIFLSGGNATAFLSAPSAMIVIGGTLAAGFIGYQARYVILSIKEIGQLLVKEKINRTMLTVETGKIIRWGYLVKKHGILALEREIKSAKQQDHFLNYGVELVITGYAGDEVRGGRRHHAAQAGEREYLENAGVGFACLWHDRHLDRPDHHPTKASLRP